MWRDGYYTLVQGEISKGLRSSKNLGPGAV